MRIAIMSRWLPRRRLYRGRRTLFVVVACWLSMLASPSQGGLLDKLDAFDPTPLGRQFLPPERAFAAAAESAADGLHVKFTIAAGYYLYRDKFKFQPVAPATSVGTARFPPGTIIEDPEFGRVEVYYDSVVILLATTPAPAAITVAYQGCAENGICYPPMTKTVTATPVVALEASPRTAPASPQPPLSESDRLTNTLRDGISMATLAAFYFFGLLLAATPCVFPMIPILSGIIVGQQAPMSALRGFLLSLVYVLAMALTYAALGVIAGRFGQNLQILFQHPLAIVSFAAVFVLFALAMFGFFTLQIPAPVQSRLDRLSRSQRGGTAVGVALMGVLATVIVGPCVVPPLAGALVYLSQQGDPLVGGAALFAMGLGMGTPLLLIGASAGRYLPRAGAWMERIKWFFGVIFLGLAIWFLARVLPGPLSLMLWALLLIAVAVYLGALDRLSQTASGWSRLARGFGVAVLCYGIVLIVGAAAGADDPLAPLAPLAGTRSGIAATDELDARPRGFTAVKGSTDLEAQLASAGRPALLDFYADWCIECKHLERRTFTDRRVQAALGDIVLLRADITAYDAQDQALLKRFDLFGPPAVLFFDADGREQRHRRVLGYVPPEKFIAHLSANDMP